MENVVLDGDGAIEQFLRQERKKFSKEGEILQQNLPWVSVIDQ